MKPLKRFWELVKTGELQLVAGALSFSTLLSLIPFMAVSLATLQYVGGLETIYPKVEKLVLQYFQGPTGTEGVQIVKKVFRRIHAGRMGSWGAVALVLASIFMINDMERGLNRIWNLTDRRPVHKRIFLYWIFMVIFPAALAIYVAVSSMKVFSGATSSLSNQVINDFLLFFTLYFVYKVVPNTKVSIGAAAVGAFTGTLGLIALFRSFKWLSQSFFSWGKLYGSFAAAPTLLIWVLLTWYMVLVGAAVTASFRK
ncbi:MAG: YihY/virulence factor BrkB family protein [Pseudobdellovibrionaceae bacterium]